jgi:hypothetical protein
MFRSNALFSPLRDQKSAPESKQVGHARESTTMSDAEQQQQIAAEEQQQYDGDGDEGDYSSSDDDEWTRPSAAVKKDEEGGEADAGADGQKKAVDYSWDEDERRLAGGDVLVDFIIEMPGAAPYTLPPQPFVMGVTVAHLKTFLEDGHKISYAAQQMFLGEQMLIDPLSLNDVGFQAGHNTVRVVVAAQ